MPRELPPGLANLLRSAGPAQLALAGSVLEMIDEKLAVDWETKYRDRFQRLIRVMKEENIPTYDVIRVTVPIGDKYPITFFGNTFVILQGTGLDISFEENQDIFPWDEGDIWDQFPFSKVTLHNNTVAAIDVIILVIYRGDI